MPAKDWRLVMKASARKELLALPGQAASRMQRAINYMVARYRLGESSPDVRPITGRPTPTA